jgi:hypothetical protein
MEKSFIRSEFLFFSYQQIENRVRHEPLALSGLDLDFWIRPHYTITQCSTLSLFELSSYQLHNIIC